ncbi:MAG: VWA domain-containing protein, partial [Candidatus Paceibacterota bacterium]
MIEGNMTRRAVQVFLLVTALAGLHAESRSANVDFLLLMDTSLSMADCMDAARKYAAGEVIGRLVQPGDWVSIMKFYGKSETVWQGDVQNQENIAAMVRSLNELKADGRYTDIGS